MPLRYSAVQEEAFLHGRIPFFVLLSAKQTNSRMGYHAFKGVWGRCHQQAKACGIHYG